MAGLLWEFDLMADVYLVVVILAVNDFWAFLRLLRLEKVKSRAKALFIA